MYVRLVTYYIIRFTRSSKVYRIVYDAVYPLTLDSSALCRRSVLNTIVTLQNKSYNICCAFESVRVLLYLHIGRVYILGEACIRWEVDLVRFPRHHVSDGGFIVPAVLVPSPNKIILLHNMLLNQAQ